MAGGRRGRNEDGSELHWPFSNARRDTGGLAEYVRPGRRIQDDLPEGQRVPWLPADYDGIPFYDDVLEVG